MRCMRDSSRQGYFVERRMILKFGDSGQETE